MSEIERYSIAPNCLGNHSALHDKSADKLLNRNLLDRDFEMFSGPWLKRADRAAGRGEWFEAFIYLWVTFNGWLSVIVADRNYSERDWYLWRACGVDPIFNQAFNMLIEEDQAYKETSYQFRDLWPVFKVRALVENGIGHWGMSGFDEGRSEFRARCFDAGISKSDYAPECYLNHQDKGFRYANTDPKKVPLDWGHTLGAIYQVRCNLFHGGKSYRYSHHKVFVELAYKLLNKVWRRAGITKHRL